MMQVLVGRVIKTFTFTFFVEHLFKLGLMQAIPYVFVLISKKQDC